MTADHVKRITIGELNSLPNRYIHSYWKMAYDQMIWDEKHPKEAQSRMMGEALAQELT